MKRSLSKDRPPPLQISRPPPASNLHSHHHQPHGPPRIIHTYSPEVIAIEADKFRQLVQRLTGPGSHTPPPRKRPRHFAPAPALPEPLLPAPPPPLPPPIHSPALPHHPLLSPSLFDFSPSVLPSPSVFALDLPSLSSPMGTRAPAGTTPWAGLLGPSPRGMPRTPRTAAFPSPGPLTAFLNDLPALSPMGQGSLLSAEGILASRSGLPPRPPPLTIHNLFPQSPSPAFDQRHHR